ncbi:Glutamyl-tRNA reductase [Candidatus Rubidus massiliensis]|nr:MAG: glutamyl-tRNA reductase [Chlamydia sp. 32-24]CDZ80912.1 Glutamyl-tRNA reductase [Candidatus Rubidus massiliensis]
MRVGIVGINHKLADLKLREALAKACNKKFSAGFCFHENQFFILLSTCNRTEIYFFSEDLAATHTYIITLLRQEVEVDFEQKLYSFFGFDCFLHLCRVTAGLDSAIVAETEIQGQVKNAYEKVQLDCNIPSDLHYIFQKSLKVGKKIRSNLLIKPGIPNFEDAIYSIGSCHFFNLQKARILFVGASEINKKVISHFVNKKIKALTLCNRTKSRGMACADNFSIQFIPWEELENWNQYDWVIVGTHAEKYLISYEDIPLQTSLIMDLSVPRNVDPKMEQACTLYNIDQINQSLSMRKFEMTQTLLKAEKIVYDSAQKLYCIYKEKEKNKNYYFANIA